MNRSKWLLCTFLLLAAFVLRSGGQGRESARVEIMARAGDETLQVTRRGAFHLVAFASPDFSFASVPTDAEVEAGEYRAWGKTRWEGKAAVWSLTIRSTEAQTPMPSSCRFYLSVMLWRERKLVYECGTPQSLRAAVVLSAPVIEKAR